MEKISRHEKFLRAVIIALTLFGLAVNVCRAQDKGKVTFTRKGDNFILTSAGRSTAKDSTKTAYTLTDRKGVTRTVYMNAKGRCFVGRTSAKTGKYYRQYIPKEIEDEMAKENL